MFGTGESRGTLGDASGEPRFVAFVANHQSTGQVRLEPGDGRVQQQPPHPRTSLGPSIRPANRTANQTTDHRETQTG